MGAARVNALLLVPPLDIIIKLLGFFALLWWQHYINLSAKELPAILLRQNAAGHDILRHRFSLSLGSFFHTLCTYINFSLSIMFLSPSLLHTRTPSHPSLTISYFSLSSLLHYISFSLFLSPSYTDFFLFLFLFSFLTVGSYATEHSLLKTAFMRCIPAQKKALVKSNLKLSTLYVSISLCVAG